jgi:single-strand DNA-binding protein
MANLNKVMLIGRLTRDPEVRTFGTGGKVAAFGFAVNNKKKNPQTGEWEDEPVFLDIEAFNRESGRKLADLVEQYFKKGAQFYLEGHLRLDQWQDKNDGSKRSRLKIVLDDFQFFESRQDGMNAGGGGAPRATSRMSSGPAPARRPAPAAPAANGNFDEPEPDFVDEPPQGGDGGDIPF